MADRVDWLSEESVGGLTSLFSKPLPSPQAPPREEGGLGAALLMELRTLSPPYTHTHTHTTL